MRLYLRTLEEVAWALAVAGLIVCLGCPDGNGGGTVETLRYEEGRHKGIPPINFSVYSDGSLWGTSVDNQDITDLRLSANGGGGSGAGYAKDGVSCPVTPQSTMLYVNYGSLSKDVRVDQFQKVN